VGRTHYYTASSLDGFIATGDDSLDWLLTRNYDPRGPMGYELFFERIGAIALGASTYQWLLDHGGWSYGVPAWVFTHRRFPAPAGDIRFTSADVAAVHAEMTAAAGDKDLWIMGGGGLAGQFASRGLLDEVWIQYAPVTLGAGKPLLPAAVELRLVEVATNGDFACTHYETAPGGEGAADLSGQATR